MRTHLYNEKVRSLLECLERTATNYDVGLVVDETNGRPPIDHDRIVWHSVDACHPCNLSCAASRPLWWCGDFPLYFAFEQFPSYDYYFMIEYDVHLTAGDGAIFTDLIDRLLARSPYFDAVGMRFRREDTPSDLARAAFVRFGEVHSFFLPVVGVSRQAVAYMYAQRQIECLRGTPADQVVYCEAFIPSVLLAGGFRVGDINEIIPNAYDERLMIIPGRFIGLPLGLAGGFQFHSTMIHPVYGAEEFLSRFLSRFTHRGWLEYCRGALDDPSLDALPASLRETYRAKLDRSLSEHND